MRLMPVAAPGPPVSTASTTTSILAFLDIGGRPDGVERLVETEARIDVARKLVGFGDDRFERCADERIAMRLAAGQRAGIAAQERQVRCKFLTKRHMYKFSQS